MTKIRPIFGQLLILHWDDVWPDSIWTAIRTIATRARFEIPDQILTPSQLRPWLWYKPGYYWSLYNGLQKIGYTLNTLQEGHWRPPTPQKGAT